MESTLILIRFASEIGLKGRNRIDFEKKLINNIKEQIKRFSLILPMKTKKKPEFRIRKEHTRIIIEPSGKQGSKGFSDEELKIITTALRFVFGISSFSVVSVCEANMEDIKRESWIVFKEELLKKIKEKSEDGFKGNDRDRKKKISFKVTTKRINKKFPIESPDVNKIIGEYLLQKANHEIKETEVIVDLKEATINVQIEILDRVFITTKREDGLNGLPVGIQGEAILYLKDIKNKDDEEKALLSCFLVMKRGVNITIIGKEEEVKKHKALIDKISLFTPELKVKTTDKKSRNSRGNNMIDTGGVVVEIKTIEEVMRSISQENLSENNKENEKTQLKLLPLVTSKEFLNEKKKIIDSLLKLLKLNYGIN